MNEEIDESEFYHQDFTTASEWEIFIARIEEIINQWKTEDLKNESQKEINNSWEIKTEQVTFVDFTFDLILYRKIIDEDPASQSSDEKQIKNPIDSWYDFELYDQNKTTKDSLLAAWYGLSEYIVVSPASKTGITNESKIKILLSSLHVIANDLNLEIPLFIQIREKWQNLYLGVYEGESIRTNFEIVHLKRGPQYSQYLTGLLDLFKTKIMSPCTIENITVSLQCTYNLTDFGNFLWKQDIDSEHIDVENLFILPFGVSVDPISTIILKATWQHLPEHSVIDSESYSDFDPMQASKWSCLVNMTNEPVCLLGDCLTEFNQILNNNLTIYDILGDFAVVNIPESNPLDLLTEPSVPTISSILSRAARNSLGRNKRTNPPITESVLVPLLYFLFPDADDNSSFPYGSKDDKEPTEKKPMELFQNLEEEFKGFKTCGMDSLTWRLVIVLAHSLQSLGGIRAFTHIWYEFVQEMRYRWEKSMPIPGLAPGFPDLRTCLLNQKLQMLNSCIERKMSRENLQTSHYDSAENSEDSDDEFFDCSSEKPVDDAKRKAKYSLWNQPVGRLSKFGDLKLLKSGDPLYIPITQDPVLKTEDQLEEDTDVLLKLGSNQEASELRARIMSASLLSDMESFKAANPGSVVEDFIRWYSPRDWIEEDELDEFGQKKGHLSPRMVIQDNIWGQMWESAKPVPASRQKRLFDDTREAEKILQFLDFRTVGQLAELAIPVLSHCSICRLVDELENIAADVGQSDVRINSLLRHGERISRDSKFSQKRFEVFVQEVTALELILSQVNSLQYKFNPSGVPNAEVTKSVGNLVMGKEIEIEDKGQSPIGSRLVSMFCDAHQLTSTIYDEPGEVARSNLLNSVFPSPFEREFVLRAKAVRPACYAARCPQFLRAILGKNEFRLVGAFSEDIAFF